jgi:hypothetical protein
MLAGTGLSLEEYTKIGLAFKRLNNSTALKNIKKIYKILFKEKE